MEALTWAALVAFSITTIGTLLVHYKTVKHIYEEQGKLEQQRRQIERDNEIRQKSQIVAELFSLWNQSAPGGLSKKELTPDEFKKLNQLSYECGLWLPPAILNDLSDTLAGKPGAKDRKQILVDVRYNLNPDSPKVDWTKIIHW